MGSLQSVRPSSSPGIRRVQPKKLSEREARVRERYDVLNEYLNLLEELRSNESVGSRRVRTLDTLYRLVEMTEISDITRAKLVSDWHIDRRPVVIQELD